MVMGSSPSDSTTGVPIPTIRNVVSSVDLDCKLDLKRLSCKALNTEYDPDRSSALTMKIQNPNTTALIFTSGKLVCIGAKSEEDSEAAARKFVGIIRKLGFPVRFTAFKIDKFVASCHVLFPIKLEKLACSNHSVFSIYEPELYPGLIYRMKQPDASILIFASGKIVLAGAKTREEVNAAFNNIYPLLQKFSK